MAGSHSNPLEHPEVRMGGTIRYLAGFVSTILLMYIAMVVAVHRQLHPDTDYETFVIIVGALLLVALLLQAGVFYGLDISKAQIWKSISLTLTLPLFVITVGLTVWMFQSLNHRTMLMPVTTEQPTLLQ